MFNAAARLVSAASALEVAEVTGRSGAFESGNLNQISVSGLVAKAKYGRKLFFRLKDSWG
jgi:hypothetical protein